jgi:hypothetical protein
MRIWKDFNLHWLLTAIMLLLLAGCGGGSDGNPSNLLGGSTNTGGGTVDGGGSNTDGVVTSITPILRGVSAVPVGRDRADYTLTAFELFDPDTTGSDGPFPPVIPGVSINLSVTGRCLFCA